MTFEDTIFGPYDQAEHKARKAFELYEDGRISQALAELQEAIEINPSNSSWHFNKALGLDAINRFDEAIGEYEIALQLNPSDPEILNSLAVDYTRSGQYDLAIDTFERIEKLDPSFEPSYCNRIITYTEMGQHDLAEQMFYLAQQINPDCALCFYNIGNSLFIRGQYAKAIRCWLKTAELEPSHPQINYRIAQAYWSAGEKDRAREYFLAELRISPGDIDVILDFGLFLLQTGDTESAKEKFNRILELAPDSTVALFYLGEIAFDSADYDKAVELFNQALQKDNTLAGPRYRLAQYALMNGQKQKARIYLVSELELASEDADTLVSMGSMFLTISDSGRAVWQAAKGKKRWLGGPRLAAQRKTAGPAEFDHTPQRAEAPDMDYAAQCLIRAIGLDHANADAHYYLGLASAIKGEFEDAAEFFAHTLDINPRHIGALRDSAIVYLAAGRPIDAAERIGKALEIAGNDSQLKALNRRIASARLTGQISGFLRQLRPRFVHKQRLR